MKPLKRRNGNQYLHKEAPEYRAAVRNKSHTYHVHLFMGVVTQGLMHYLSALALQSIAWRNSSLSDRAAETIRHGEMQRK